MTKRDANAPLTESEMRLLSPAERQSVMAARRADAPDPLLATDHTGSPLLAPGRVLIEQGKQDA